MSKITRAAAALLLALALPGPGCAGGGEQETPPLRPHPAGVLARGQQLDDRWLDEALPPPPRDAVAYEVRDPLRNGRTVAVKKRWLWIPDGKRLEATPTAAGLALKVPVGTKLWKEFYVGAGGAPTLVERRLLLKVPTATTRTAGCSTAAGASTPRTSCRRAPTGSTASRTASASSRSSPTRSSLTSGSPRA